MFGQEVWKGSHRRLSPGELDAGEAGNGQARCSERVIAVNPPAKNPTPREGKWGNPNMMLNKFRLLPATEDQSESTESEKGGGGRFGDALDLEAI